MNQAYLKELIRQSFDCTKYLKNQKVLVCSAVLYAEAAAAQTELELFITTQILGVGIATGVGRWVTFLRFTSWNMASISTQRFEHWRNSLARRSSRTAQSPRGSVHPLWLPCSPALRRRICLITSRNAVPDCMTLPLFPS